MGMQTQKIEGERIFLASLDADRLSSAYQQWMQDPQVLRYLSSPEGDYSGPSLRKFVKDSNESPHEYLFGIFLKSDDRHIGNIKIGGIHPKHKFADVGIVIGERKLWGQGFATEAIKVCVAYAFNQLGLHKLFSGMVAGVNEGSYKPFLKAGFHDVGRYRKHFLIDGRFRDGKIVEIINERANHAFKIGQKTCGDGNLFFVVEEGQANLGDFDKALRMVEAVSKTGADAVEFQLARAGDFYVKDHPGFATYLEREFSDAQHRELIGCAKDKGLEFIAVALSHKLVEPLTKAGCSGFNINASDLTNPDMIDAVLDSGLPFFLSLSMAQEEEIEWAISRIQAKKDAVFALLHGQHTMAGGLQGVDVEHTSLGYLGTLKQKYGLPAGFIDHTPCVWMPAVAVAAGAELVSKHLALSRAEKGPDWHVCLEPDEMKEAVYLAKSLKKSINVRDKVLAPGENFDRSIMRRSIVAAKTIPEGKKIERNDMEFKRPGNGVDPAQYEDFLGRIALREIKQDEQLTFSNVQEVSHGS